MTKLRVRRVIEKLYCSFCARPSDEAGPMFESSDRIDERNLVRICAECARLALEMLDNEAEQRGETPSS